MPKHLMFSVETLQAKFQKCSLIVMLKILYVRLPLVEGAQFTFCCLCSILHIEEQSFLTLT